jgi:alkylhydroperoxidase family enzyme
VALAYDEIANMLDRTAQACRQLHHRASRRLDEYATSPRFSPRERAALALAEAMVRDVHVSDDTWSTIRAHFDDRELVELVVAVAMETFYNRVNAALAIEAQGFCELPRLTRAEAAA